MTILEDYQSARIRSGERALECVNKIAEIIGCQYEDLEDLVEAVRLLVAERDAARAAARPDNTLRAAIAGNLLASLVTREGYVALALGQGLAEAAVRLTDDLLTALAGVEP